MRRVATPAALLGAVLAATIAAPRGARAADRVRVVLLDAPEVTPAAEAVRERLRAQLEPVAVDVDLLALEAPPADAAELARLAGEAGRARPGTLALITWSCPPGGGCELTAVEPARGGRTAIPIERPGQSDEERAFAVTATARELLVGTLLIELERVAAEGADPSEPPPVEARSPSAVQDGAPQRPARPWLFVEGGYHGEYPHPGGGPVHGPFVGLAIAPRPYVAPALTVGWLGVRSESVPAGEAATHRLPVSLAVRLTFDLGAASFCLAPVGRVDTVFARADERGPGDESGDTFVEIHLGGVTSWHLPFPGNVEAVVGAGVLATVLGEGVDVGATRALDASSVRIVWSAGIAWSPLD